MRRASTEDMKAVPEDRLARAREFYREQLAMAFCHSHAFSRPLGSAADSVVDTPQFDAMVRECEPGSFDCARRIGDMAVVHLDRIPAIAAGAADSPGNLGAWWRDLLNYERGCFLQSATTAQGPPTNRPRRGLSAVCMNFSWAVPDILDRLKRGDAITDQLRRPTTLLFARGGDGRVGVVEVGSTVEKVFRATNGLRTLEQIAATAGTGVEETKQVLQALAQIGAVVAAMSPEHMARLITAREKSK